MIRRLCAATIMAGTLALPPLASADASDPLRCEAIGMRKQSQRYDCLSHCDRHNGRRVDRLGVNADTSLGDCQQACENHYADAMDRLDQSDVCTGPTPVAPDPNHCQARLLNAAATQFVCKSQCSARANSRPDFDLGACTQACDDRYSALVDRIMAEPFCAGQPAPTN